MAIINDGRSGSNTGKQQPAQNGEALIVIRLSSDILISMGNTVGSRFATQNDPVETDLRIRAK